MADKTAIEIEHERVMREGTTEEKLMHLYTLAIGLKDILQDWGEAMEQRKNNESRDL